MTPYRLHAYFQYTRKALINVIGIAGVLLSEGLVPKPYDHYVTVGIAVVAAAIHYAVPNAAKPGSVGALDAVDDGAEDDDAYVPVGASDDDLVSVEATPAADRAPEPDVDAQRLIAAMFEVFLRAARSTPGGVTSNPPLDPPEPAFAR